MNLNRAFDEATSNILTPASRQVEKGMLENDTLTATISTNGFEKLDLKPGPNSRVVFQSDQPGIATEQYRLLRKSLTDQFPEGAVVIVTSPTKGDGKTVNAANLAWCFAETAAPTLLLEADLRQPNVAQMLGFRPHQGVEAVMAGEVRPESAVAVTSNNGFLLHVAAVSKPQRDPIRLLKNPATKNLLEWARSRFFWVLLDCPPIVPAVDVMELTRWTDAVLLVVRVRSTPVDLVRKSFQMLGDQVKGVILNEATLCQDSYYHYLSGYNTAKQR